MWMSDIASALFDVHSQNYIHRDLKPESLFIDDAGLKLSLTPLRIPSHLSLFLPLVGRTGDFGLAVVFQRTEPTKASLVTSEFRSHFLLSLFISLPSHFVSLFFLM
jgi:serine/threonine protein kinase